MGKYLRPAGAFASGVLFNQVLEVFLGVLAAVTIPKGYWAWFGAHKVVALFIEEAVVYALPAFLLAFFWGRLTVRLIGLSHRGALWCMAGLVVAWGVSDFQAMQLSELPLPKLLIVVLVPPVWGILPMLAPPLGLLMAGGFGRRGQPPTANAEARKFVERAVSPFGDRVSRRWDGAAP